MHIPLLIPANVNPTEYERKASQKSIYTFLLLHDGAFHITLAIYVIVIAMADLGYIAKFWWHTIPLGPTYPEIGDANFKCTL